MFTKSWSEIDNKSTIYYNNILRLCRSMPLPDNLAFIVVDHCLQTSESHLDSLSKLGRVAGVILKSSTRDSESEGVVKSKFHVINATKEDLKSSDFAINLILQHIHSNEKLVILDHGGYFTPCLQQITSHDQIQKQLLGIVEVTENGHAKLEKKIAEVKLRAISIARSEIKELEDMQVGISICDVSNSLLYSIHSSLSSLKSVCVLGYGKIGRSIANHCRKIGIPSVTVIEIDSLRAQFALHEGHTVIVDRDHSEQKINAFKNAQMIFSATGSKALSKADIPYLRHNQDRKSVLFIASCTSPDDEFSDDFFSELNSISKNSSSERASCEAKFKLTPYEIYDGRDIYILNGGKSVNFALGGTPGYEICQVWAAVLFATAKVASCEIDEASAVQTLTRADQQKISQITYSIYLSSNVDYAHSSNRIRRSSSCDTLNINLFNSASRQDRESRQLHKYPSTPF